MISLFDLYIANIQTYIIIIIIIIFTSMYSIIWLKWFNWENVEILKSMKIDVSVEGRIPSNGLTRLGEI